MATSIMIAGVGLVTAYAHIVILGLPLLYVFNKWGLPINATLCTASGFVVGILPFSSYILAIRGSVDKQDNLEGVLTCILTLGIFGALIGFVFYRIGIREKNS